jgi:hypothetical protein
VAGYGVHSSKIITTSEFSTRWMRIDSSGVRNSLSPLTGEANFTPSSPILRSCAQREHLEAAGVGEYRSVPAHEAMQAAVFLDDIEPRPQPQVKGVAEDDLRVHFHQLARRHRLDRAIGAHRHEDRRLHRAVVERQRAAARMALGAMDLEVAGHGSGWLRSSSMASP